MQFRSLYFQQLEPETPPRSPEELTNGVWAAFKPGFTESESKHSQALQDAHKLFVNLSMLSARVCEEG